MAPSDLSEQLAELKTRLESQGHVTVKREYTADMSQQTGRKRCIPSEKLRNWMIQAISRESSLSADEIRSRMPKQEHRHFYWLMARLSPKAIETLLNKLKTRPLEDSEKNEPT